MGKFKRLSIEEARNEFPLINEEAQQALKGGCDFHEIWNIEGCSWGQLVEKLKNGETGELWVCGMGLVRMDEGGYAFVVCPESNYAVCKEHDYVFESSKYCVACYFDSLSHCDAHNKYFTAFGSCDYCSSYVDPYASQSYCETHGNYFMPEEFCSECEHDFIAQYPFGCFEHKQEQDCTVCDENENGPHA